MFIVYMKISEKAHHKNPPNKISFIYKNNWRFIDAGKMIGMLYWKSSQKQNNREQNIEWFNREIIHLISPKS